jgi:GNAT superfamily N-acetyltransferase
VNADAELIERLDCSTVRSFASLSEHVPGARVIRQDGLVLVIGTDPSPVIVNTILPENRDVRLPAVAAAVDVYAAIGHVPSLFTRDHADAALQEALGAAGWRLLLPLPGMVLEQRPAREAVPAGVTIHPVRTEADRLRWIEGNLEGFAESDEDRSALRSAFPNLDSLAGPGITAAWAEADGRGVASAVADVDPETGFAIVGWVGTDVAYRRRGIGRAVTLATVDAAFDLGASTIGLQASPMGLPVYEKLGFRTITGYRIWLPPDDSSQGR